MDTTIRFAVGLAVLLIFTYFYFRRERKIMEEQDRLRREIKWKTGEDVTKDNSLWWW